MKFLILVPIIAIALFMACGGGGDDDSERTLELNTGTFTESEFRAQARASITQAACDLIQDIPPDELTLVIDELQKEDNSEVVQQGDPEDRNRAAAITLEECKRID